MPTDEEKTIQTIVEMSEGVPGAIVVLTALAKAGRYDVLLKLKAEGIKGSTIWVGLKDGAAGNLERFCELVMAWNQELVAIMKSEMDS